MRAFGDCIRLYIRIMKELWGSLLALAVDSKRKYAISHFSEHHKDFVHSRVCDRNVHQSRNPKQDLGIITGLLNKVVLTKLLGEDGANRILSTRCI